VVAGAPQGELSYIVASEQESVTIYCDGACSGNQFKGNRGGWGAVLSYKGAIKEMRGGVRNTSNQRMELTACIEALECLKGDKLDVAVYSDSAYMVNGMQQKWYERWETNGWLNYSRKPVENRDLWERLLKQVRRHHVVFRKVTGHSGVEQNERADQLAKTAISELDGGNRA
jgi:ribonuclease HI